MFPWMNIKYFKNELGLSTNTDRGFINLDFKHWENLADGNGKSFVKHVTVFWTPFELFARDHISSEAIISDELATWLGHLSSLLNAKNWKPLDLQKGLWLSHYG